MDAADTWRLLLVQAPRSWVLEGQPAALGARGAAIDTWMLLDRQAGFTISPLDAGQALDFVIKIQIPCFRCGKGGYGGQGGWAGGARQEP